MSVWCRDRPKKPRSILMTQWPTEERACDAEHLANQVMAIADKWTAS